MTTLVVDASVAFKWCAPSAGEPLVTQAVQLLDAFGRQQITFLVPDLFWVELGNALWKLVRRGRIASAEAATALSAVKNLEIPTIPSVDLVPQALQIAMTYDRTVYDSLYVALATTSRTEFVTADERLANALAAYFPVKWLGAV